MEKYPDRRQFVTLGIFIVDEFAFEDDDGRPTGKTEPPQIGGGGTYAAIGARIWFDSKDVGMIIDRGNDFLPWMQQRLDSYGADMWLFRDHTDRITTRALNYYKGDHRGFKYLTPRLRLTPRDLTATKLERPKMLHFICSPTRASEIISEVHHTDDWSPITIFEPIPDRSVPEELPALLKVLPFISILSPNAEEAFSLLSMPLPVTKRGIEEACEMFLKFGVGESSKGSVIIRSGALGAHVANRDNGGRWIDAYWTENDLERVVDVTGAGNGFLGGLGAGLIVTGGDIYEAALYASVSASFIIEQGGLPSFSDGLWNGESPRIRLDKLRTKTK